MSSGFEAGVDFPPGMRTGQAVRSCLAASARAMAPLLGSGGGAAAALREAEALETMPHDDWRGSYTEHIVRHTELQASSTAACLAGARAGLREIYASFRFAGVPLRQAVATGGGAPNLPPQPFATGFVRGHRQALSGGEADVQLPLGKGGRLVLKGAEAVNHLNGWAAAGVVEPDVVRAVEGLRERGDLASVGASQWSFVVLGAGAAMGPFETLLSLGANVVAVDLPRPAMWRRLLALARDSPGTLTFPIRGNSSSSSMSSSSSSSSSSSKGAPMSDEELSNVAGADLLKEPLRIRDWLVGLDPSKRLVLGAYAYLDSANFVRVTLAMDVIGSGVLARRKDSALAYLCSPTDVFAVPRAARERSVAAFAAAEAGREEGASVPSSLHRVVPMLRSGALARNVAEQGGQQLPGRRLPLVDSLVVQQGPNYCFAKRLQHWRAMVARHEGHVVSSNVAPASNTLSVLKNPLLAAAFRGADLVKPLLIFEPETSNVLMTYLLLHDLHDQREAGRPRAGKKAAEQQKGKELEHPLMLFASTAVHNGSWTCAYQLRSVLELVVAAEYLNQYGTAAVGAVAFVFGGAAALLRARL